MEKKCKEAVSLVFTGDIGFDKYMDHGWEREDLISDEVREFIHSGDHVIVNVEGPLSEQKKIEVAGGGAKLTHTMNPAAVKFLRDCHADVWNICNNHICDAGAEGVLDTLAMAKAEGVTTIGAGKDLEDAMKPLTYKEAGGIGMFAVGYQRACRKADDHTPGCFSWSDMENIEKTIHTIKKTCRWCIMVVHGGEEFTSLPNRYTRDRYLKYLELGADLVVCHHPHVPMNYELLPGKAIFYSLGNFVFDTDYQRSQYHTEDGVLLKLVLTEEDFTFEAMGLKINRGPETITKAELPGIFTDVPEEEYKLLEPLAAKQFIEATKRQLRYMKPAEFQNATWEDFMKNFYEPLRSGRVPGEVLDLQIVVPIAEQEKEKAWQKSGLEKVRQYILEQM